jgi:hypothetical protein
MSSINEFKICKFPGVIRSLVHSLVQTRNGRINYNLVVLLVHNVVCSMVQIKQSKLKKELKMDNIARLQTCSLGGSNECLTDCLIPLLICITYEQEVP